jgi:hypothetical protein
MAKFNGIQDDLALGVDFDQFESAVRIKGRANIETWFCGIVPRLPPSRLCMDEDATTNRTKWSFVEVKGPLKNSHALILGLSVA